MYIYGAGCETGARTIASVESDVLHIENVSQPLETKQYYDEFINIVGTGFTTPGTIIFARNPVGNLGLCFTDVIHPTWGWTIHISGDYWIRLNDHERRVVLFHELTHCTMNEEHSDDPTSYMYFAMKPISEEALRTQLKEIAAKHR